MADDSFIDSNNPYDELTQGSCKEDPFERGKSMPWDLDDDFFNRQLDFIPIPALDEDSELYNNFISHKPEPLEAAWPNFQDTELVAAAIPNSSQSSPLMTSIPNQTLPSQSIHETDYFSSCDETTVERNEEDLSLELKIKDIQKNFVIQSSGRTAQLRTQFKREIQKPPTTAGITLNDLKAVFHLERPKAEKRLRLKRTTFSNLSRYYGISKWPFRTIRDAMNRMNANDKMLKSKSLSKEKSRKLKDQQRLLSGVIDLIYSDPKESKDTNTLAVLLRIVAARENPEEFSDV